MAAIADPPQIPVPAEIKLESFQLRPSALPIKYPPPKQVKRVNSITVKDMLPTVRIVVMFSESPSRIMASFRTFFDVNLSPEAKKFVFLKK